MGLFGSPRKKRYRGFVVEIKNDHVYVWSGMNIVFSYYGTSDPIELASRAKNWIDAIHEARKVFA